MQPVPLRAVIRVRRETPRDEAADPSAFDAAAMVRRPSSTAVRTAVRSALRWFMRRYLRWQVDCVVGAWGGWSACDDATGRQDRTRLIVTPPYEGRACPALDEKADCMVACVLDAWAPWGECSASCGGGKRVRQRAVEVSEKHGGAKCGSTEEADACNTGGCVLQARTAYTFTARIALQACAGRLRGCGVVCVGAVRRGYRAGEAHSPDRRSAGGRQGVPTARAGEGMQQGYQQLPSPLGLGVGVSKNVAARQSWQMLFVRICPRPMDNRCGRGRHGCAGRCGCVRCAQRDGLRERATVLRPSRAVRRFGAPPHGIRPSMLARVRRGRRVVATRA
jgi:hypothetical protein